MSIADDITKSRCWGERAVDMCRKAVASAPAGNAPFIAEAGHQAGSGRAANQLSHFRGHQFTAISAIAKRVAGQAVKVYQSLSAPRGTKAVEWKENDSHPLALALKNPNPILSRWQMLYITVASLNLTGEALWWIMANGSKLDFWPIPRSWARPNNALRTSWTVRPHGTGEEIQVPGEFMMFCNLPDPSNPFSSVSPLQSQAAAIDTDEALQQAQAYGFHNFIKPSMILKAGRLPGPDGQAGELPTLTDAQRLQLISSIKRAFSGVHRNGEPLILDALIEDVYEYQSKSEMDFVESGKATRGRIFHAFGVNPLIVGEIEGANRAQATVAEESFCSNVCNPLIQLLNDAINKTIVPFYAADSETLMVEIEKAVAHDPDQRFKEWQIAATKNFVTPNEYRLEILGLPPITGGDELPGNTPPISPAADSLAKRINPYSLKRLSDDA